MSEDLLASVLWTDLSSWESGSHFDSQTPDIWQNDTRLCFVRFSLFVESKEIFKKFHSYKIIVTFNDVNMHNWVSLCKIFGGYRHECV